VDFPILWGTLTFLLSFIPTVGLFLAMILPDLLAGALAAVLLGLPLIEWTAPERDDFSSKALVG
jgi:predicted PurR-regulated permease PerM